VRSIRAVLVTLVVRLVPERLADGEFVGEVEHVGRGGQAKVREISDLVGFAQRAAAAEPGRDSVAGHGDRAAATPPAS
jgi:hypothetical protein